MRHVELQAKNDPDFGRRQAEYYLGFHRLLEEHVEQVVPYVGREPLTMLPVFETPSMRYEFQLLDMHDVDGEPLVESNDWGDNLLALLAQVEQEGVLHCLGLGRVGWGNCTVSVSRSGLIACRGA